MMRIVKLLIASCLLGPAAHAANVQPILYDANGKAIGIYVGRITNPNQFRNSPLEYVEAVSVKGYRVILADIDRPLPVSAAFFGHTFRYWFVGVGCQGEPALIQTRDRGVDGDAAGNYLGFIRQRPRVQSNFLMVDGSGQQFYLEPGTPELNTRNIIQSGPDGAIEPPTDISSALEQPAPSAEECGEFDYNLWNSTGSYDAAGQFIADTGAPLHDWSLMRPYMSFQAVDGDQKAILQVTGPAYSGLKPNDPAVTGFGDLSDLMYPLYVELGDIVVVFESSFGPNE